MLNRTIALSHCSRISLVVLFGAVHLIILVTIAIAAAGLAWGLRAGRLPANVVRLTFGYGLLVNELIWWAFRYSHEGVHLTNLPLQLCDMTLWVTVAACLFLRHSLVEFAYFAGLAGAGMALLTPDLWSPWPSYPAIYFFVVHGGIVAANLVLIYGQIARLKPGAPWRAAAMLVAYAALVGAFDAVTGANYMYLMRKPKNASLLDALGPWPVYLLPGLLVALMLFWLLWLPARGARPVRRTT